MCKKRAKSQSLTFPIFSILCYKNFIIVSGGGVGSNYGYENQVLVYDKKAILDKPLFQLDTKKDCIDNLRCNPKNNIIIGISGGQCFVIKIDGKGTLEIVHSFKADDTELRTAIIDSKVQNIYTGGEDNVVRAFELKSEGKFDTVKRLDLKEHSAPICFIDISSDDDLVCSCAEDRTCRIFNAKQGIQLKKITFSDDSRAPLNLRVSFCFFHKDEKHLITIQNPERHGTSYLTTWSLAKDCEPVKTITLHPNPITTACLDNEGFALGCGTVDGYAKIINTRYMEIDNEVECHDLIVKGVSFLDDSKALGSISPDATYHFLANYRPEGSFSKFSKFMVLFCILVYFLIWAKNAIMS